MESKPLSEFVEIEISKDRLGIELKGEFRERISLIVEDVVLDPPKNRLELSQYCLQVDGVVEDLYASGVRKTKKLENKIKEVRRKVLRSIIARQTQRFEWESINRMETGKAVEVLKSVMCLRLGISETAPLKDSEEWETNRQKILKVKAEDMEDWGLREAFVDEGAKFDSHLDILAAVFGDEYELKEIFESRKKELIYSWKRKDESINNVKTVISKELSLPEKASPKNSKEWIEERGKILSINVEFIKKFGLNGINIAIKKWFNSYADIVIAAFDEDYEIKEEFEKRRSEKVYSWEDRDEVIKNVRAVLSEEFKIPEIAPERDSDEWKEIRAKILKIKVEDFYRLHIPRAFQSKHFATFADLMEAVFDKEYDVKDAFRKVVYDWSTPNKTKKNVKRKIIEELKLPEVVPPKGSPGWKEARARICSISSDNFELDWGMSAALKGEFRSYVDLLIAIFEADYEIAEEIKRRKSTKVYKWETREDSIQSVRKILTAKLELDKLSPGEAKAKVLTLRRIDFKKWGIAKVYGKRGFFVDHMDALRAAFPEYF